MFTADVLLSQKFWRKEKPDSDSVNTYGSNLQKIWFLNVKGWLMDFSQKRLWKNLFLCIFPIPRKFLSSFRCFFPLNFSHTYYLPFFFCRFQIYKFSFPLVLDPRGNINSTYWKRHYLLNVWWVTQNIVLWKKSKLFIQEKTFFPRKINNFTG